jgi:hypothetical protein
VTDLRDWLPIIGPLISFVAALSGAWLGATLAGRNERLRLFREHRLNAIADLMQSIRLRVMWTASWAHLFARAQIDEDPKIIAERDMAMTKRDEAVAASWSAYYRVRLLGPKSLTKAVEAYWLVNNALLVGPMTVQSIEEDLKKLVVAEESLYSAAAPDLWK